MIVFLKKNSLVHIPRDQKKLIKNERRYLDSFLKKIPPISCIEKLHHRTAPYLLVYHGFYQEFQKVQKLLGITTVFKEAIIDLNQCVPGFNNTQHDFILELIKQEKLNLEKEQGDQGMIAYFNQIITYGNQ